MYFFQGESMTSKQTVEALMGQNVGCKKVQ